MEVMVSKTEVIRRELGSLSPLVQWAAASG
jgi:hypothetical protein